MLVPVFTLNLNHNILSRRLTIAKYDGVHPCLTAATENDKVFIHNPHHVRTPGSGSLNDPSQQEFSLLNFHQSISSLASGVLKPDSPECLLIGTPNNLLVYDVQNNSDVFFKEVPHGVNCIEVGPFGEKKETLAFVGGNCLLQAFDHTGEDKFWTVMGDMVCSLALCDFTGSGTNELIVGSEDFDIRIYKEDQIVGEVKETEAVTGLSPMGSDCFAYILANGTVGVYQRTERLWRIKSKNQAISVFSFDLDGDGIPELITGWSNGKVDARNVATGEVVFKDNFVHGIAGISKSDYRMDGQEQLIIASVDGEVRGYAPSSFEIKQQQIDASFEQETVRELSQKKQQLLLELKNYEENSRMQANTGFLGSSAKSTRPTHETDSHGVIPSNTQLKTGLAIEMGSGSKPPHVEVAVQTSNDTIIRSVLIFAEGIFEGESYIVHPKESQVGPSLRIPLYPPKDVPIDLHIKTFIGIKGSQHYHVFELTRQLPRFAMYALCSDTKGEEPQSYCKFEVGEERVDRIWTWLSENFLLLDDFEMRNSIDFAFLSLRTAKLLIFRVSSAGEAELRSDDIELAGDLIQSLAQFLQMENLSVLASFPQEIEKLNKLLAKVNELQNIRQRLLADMADNSGVVRSLVLHAEDARLMGEYATMRHWYQELHGLNRDLINGYNIRASNQDELLECLKQVNQIIQKAAQLRTGKAKTQVINGCRNAIKTNNIPALVKVIHKGEV